MKKLFFLFILLFAGIMVHAQSTRVMESNLTLKKTTPTFYLQGSGAVLNFNNDLSFIQSSNKLTLSGGNLDLGSNSLFMSGGQIGTLLGPVSSIFASGVYANNFYSNFGSSVIGETGSRFLKGWFTDLEITNTPTINGVTMPVANWNTAYTDRLKWDGGNTDLVASDGRTSLGATTVGSAFFMLTNPGAITFPRINANNSVSALSAADLKTALSLTSSDVGLGNVTNESKATMFNLPTFTGAFVKHNTDTLATKAYARSVGGGIGGGISPSDTSIMLAPYILDSETQSDINDTIEARLAAASVGLVVQDYEGGSTGNDYYMTPDQVRSLIVSSGGGLDGKILKFIVGTTSGAPTTADSTLTHSEFGGKHLDVYRDGALAYYNGAIAANLNEGFRLNTNTITINPLWQDEEEVEVRILDPIAWTNLSLEGEESSLLDSLVAYWKLNEASGTLAIDEMGNKNGYVGGSAVRLVTKWGNGVKIATNLQSLRVSYNPVVYPDTSFSVSFWFYLDSLPSAMGRNGSIFGINNTNPVLPYYLRIPYEGTDQDKLQWTVKNKSNNFYSVTSAATLVDSTWYHVVAIISGSGNPIQMYLNNNVANDAVNFEGGMIAPDSDIRFGIPYTYTPDYIPHIIDEAGIWHRVLLAEEVEYLYNSGSGRTYPFE